MQNQSREKELLHEFQEMTERQIEPSESYSSTEKFNLHCKSSRNTVEDDDYGTQKVTFSQKQNAMHYYSDEDSKISQYRLQSKRKSDQYGNDSSQLSNIAESNLKRKFSREQWSENDDYDAEQVTIYKKRQKLEHDYDDEDDADMRISQYRLQLIKPKSDKYSNYSSQRSVSNTAEPLQSQIGGTNRPANNRPRTITMMHKRLCFHKKRVMHCIIMTMKMTQTSKLLKMGFNQCEDLSSNRDSESQLQNESFRNNFEDDDYDPKEAFPRFLL